MAERVKFQVFISSTYEDLKAEREQVIKAVLQMGHIPVGMEMFNAADDEQWKIITRQIDESDYYAILIAHRYGSMLRGVSYTEKEYDYAVAKGVPVIGFVIDKNAPWPVDRVDTEPDKKSKLDKFKAKVKKKPVDFWTSASELHAKFAIAFGKLITANPRPGWVRATDLPSAQVAEELSRLSKENADLRQKIETMEGGSLELDSLPEWVTSYVNVKISSGILDSYLEIPVWPFLAGFSTELLVGNRPAYLVKKTSQLLGPLNVIQSSTNSSALIRDVMYGFFMFLVSKGVVLSIRKAAGDDPGEVQLTQYGQRLMSTIIAHDMRLRADPVTNSF